MKPEISEVENALQVAVAESLEGLAFIEFDSVEQIPELPEITSKYYHSSIEIYTPFKGQIHFICPEPFMVNTIESITGEELEDLNNPILGDTLKELLNTLCGRFMIDLLPPETEFDFGLPTFDIISEDDELYQKQEESLVMKFIYEEDEVYCLFENL